MSRDRYRFLPAVILLVCLIASGSLACAGKKYECASRSYSGALPKNFHVDSRTCSEQTTSTRAHERCLRKLGWGPSLPSECDPADAERRALANACFEKAKKKIPGYSLAGCMKYATELFPEAQPNLEIESQ